MHLKHKAGIHRRIHQPDESGPHRRSSNSELQLRQPGVQAALLHQFSVPALFDQAAMVQHQDMVCLRSGLRALQGVAACTAG